MKKNLAVLFFGFSLIVSVSASAETNGSCVSECLNKGQSATTCIPRCKEGGAQTQSPLVKKQKTNTDYRCLTLCVNEGHPAAACMPQCSYPANEEASKTRPQPLNPATAVNPHRILETPVPVPQNTILTQETTKPKAELTNTDYVCVSKCMKQGMQSQICRSRCKGDGPKTETTR